MEQPSTINRLVTQGRLNESSSPDTTRQQSPALRQKTMLVLQTYGNREQFLKKLGPLAQIEASMHEELAFFSQKAPTMEEMKAIYGDNFPAMWLMEQILDLVVYSNSKGTLNDYQAMFLAQTIANEYPKLKASELLLFFYRFKAGRYGHFWGVVDPMRISKALETFCEERARVRAAKEKEAEALEQARLEREHALASIGPEEWCKAIGYPECRSVLDIWAIQSRFENTLNAILWLIGLMHNVFIQIYQTPTKCSNEKNHHQQHEADKLQGHHQP